MIFSFIKNLTRFNYENDLNYIMIFSKDVIRNKISLLNIEQSIFSDGDINNILETRKEFSRSLFLLSNLEETNIDSMNEIEKLILLFKEIVGLELLVRFNVREKIRRIFSRRISLLLSTRKEQLEMIRNQLDVLYILRSDVAHTLSINKSEEFSFYYGNDIVKAIHFANSYHKLALVRMFFTEKKIIDKTSLVLKLNEFDKLSKTDTDKKLDVPLPQYNSILSKELYRLTGIESSSSRQAFSFKLPEEREKYYLGLNSHGGLITPVHSSLDNFEYFYGDKENFTAESRIVPSTKVWNEFISLIKVKLKEIQILEPKRLRIVSKTHKSVLFFIGYYFSKTKNTIVISDIDGKEIDLKPYTINVDSEQYWDIKNQNLKRTDSEAVLILNITGHIDQIVQNEHEKLNILDLPKIICKIKLEDSVLSPTNQKLYSSEFIHRACRALELYLNNNIQTRSLRKIHLFVKSRGIFTILLGMHMRLLNYEVVHYEFGREDIHQDKEEYYRVFSSLK